jgi:hypothetical protein
MVHAFVIEPNTYNAFANEAEMIEKCKEWGLLSEKASKTKTFIYKGTGMNLPCSLIGFVDKMIAVIEFDNKQRHCIHPSLLKEMQASNYSQKLLASAEESIEPEVAEFEKQQEEAPLLEEIKIAAPKVEYPPKANEKKGRAQKLQLPEGVYNGAEQFLR